MYLTSLAHKATGYVGTFLEHPGDPSESSPHPQAHSCSSVWVLKAMHMWTASPKASFIKYDQYMLAQVVPKSTGTVTTLDLLHWDKMFCTHKTHNHRVEDTKELAR